MEQQIRFCTTSDGVRIAYVTFGEGPPLVTTPWSWQSMSHDLEEDYGGPYYGALARRCMVVVYDRRGVGLSDRERTDFTVDADVHDLEAVVDHIGLKRFALMGNFHLGPTAVSYTARHPRKVSRLVLYGTYASGRDITRDEIKTSITSMMRTHWGMASRTLADLTAPGVEGEVLERIAHIYRESATGEMAANLLEMAYSTDVSGLLPSIKVPTLVLHRQGTRTVPFRLTRELTSLLPNARLLSLEGTLYWPWLGDTESVVKSVFEFLEEEADSTRRTIPLGRDLVTILFTDMEGSTSLTERLGDAKAQVVRRTHDSIVREALQAQSGSETKHTGDGIMASFPSASRAIECAIAVQRAIAAHGETLLRVRIGLNAGEPVAEEKDLFGTAVNLARRICDQAEPGQILVSDVVQQLAAGKGFTFADKGEATLKGFEKPVRLHEVRWQE